MGMRTCSKCGDPKDEEKEFYKNSRTGKYHSWCKSCHKADSTARAKADPEGTNARSKTWRAAHPGRASEIARAWQLRNPEQFRAIQRKGLYNIDFDTMWAEQQGLCACCSEPMLPTGREMDSVCVDHNRACCPDKKSCGKCVRGLIHWRCNLMLGYAQDKPEALRCAAEYLEKRQPPVESLASIFWLYPDQVNVSLFHQGSDLWPPRPSFSTTSF